MTEVFDLDVEAGFIVAGKVIGVRVGIVSASCEENLPLYRLVAAEDSWIFVRHNERFSEIEKTQQMIPAMLENPHGRLGFPSRQNFTRNGRNSRICFESREK